MAKSADIRVSAPECDDRVFVLMIIGWSFFSAEAHKSLAHGGVNSGENGTPSQLELSAGAVILFILSAQLFLSVYRESADVA